MKKSMPILFLCLLRVKHFLLKKIFYFVIKHVEMASMLLKFNPNMINLTDKWGYTALHE